VGDSILDDGVDGIEHEPERIASFSGHEPLVISAGSPIGTVRRHGAASLQPAHRRCHDAHHVTHVT
jgi:hypothetical protein